MTTTESTAPTSHTDHLQTHPWSTLAVQVPPHHLEHVPDRVVEVWQRVIRCRDAAAMAEADVTKAAADVIDAPMQDVHGFAAADRAGEPDPGPVHLNEAQAALVDAVRVRDGRRQAAHDAAVELRGVLAAMDGLAVAAVFDEKAAETVGRARELMAELEATLLEARALRESALWAQAAPERPPMVTMDVATVLAHRRLVDGELDALLGPATRPNFY